MRIGKYLKRGDHLPPHQEHAQALWGGHTGTWRPHILLCLILTCYIKVGSACSVFLYFNFECDSKSKKTKKSRTDGIKGSACSYCFIWSARPEKKEVPLPDEGIIQSKLCFTGTHFGFGFSFIKI